jgi:hypothetical protein
MIACGHFLTEIESVFIPLGSLSIALAHDVNWKLHRLVCPEACCVGSSDFEEID